ncbi:MAG TPA: phosphatase PAP2 family protein [Rubrobacteraceae bacterium]|nr:phosphatase PAP2 family protein [Rubrobacteraceae bacterium]
MKTTTSTGLWTSITVFALFSAVAGAGWTYSADLALVHAAQRHPTVWLDRLWGYLSVAGGWELTSLALICVAAAMILRGHRRLGTRLIAAFLATALIEYLLKMLLPVHPIPESLGRSEDFAPLVAISYPYPYPSGHLLRSTILLGSLCLWSGSRAVTSLVVIYLACIGYSRFYLGVHWPSDVIGGVLLGIVGLAWTFRSKKGAA